MENCNIQFEKQIEAYSRLLEYSSNKRHKIKKEDFCFDDEVGNISRKINEDIFHKTNINAFKTNDIYQLIDYELFLERLFFEFSSNNIAPSEDVLDEIELLKIYKDVGTDYFQLKGLRIDSNIRSDLPKLSGLTIPDLKTFTLHPDNIHLISSEKKEQQFLITKNQNNRQVLFAHLSTNPKDIKNLIVQNTLSFNYSDYKKIYNNPTRMFLNIIDDYGVDITINKETKRFFNERKVYKKSLKSLHFELKTNLPKKVDFNLQFGYEPQNYGTLVSFIYGINTTEYKANHLKRNHH